MLCSLNTFNRQGSKQIEIFPRKINSIGIDELKSVTFFNKQYFAGFVKPHYMLNNYNI